MCGITKNGDKEKSPLQKGFNTNLENELTVKNFTPTDKKPQLNFNFGRSPKVFETTNCFDSRQERELDGYRFKLVPICAECRTERSLEILSNQIERRAKR